MSAEPTLEPIDLDAYFNRCAQADWFYWATDDQRVWTRGNEETGSLAYQAELVPAYDPIYRAFAAWARPVNAGPAPVRSDFIPQEIPEP